MVVYTSADAAAAAPQAESATIGKENSQTIFIDAHNAEQETGIQSLHTVTLPTGKIYNMAGQQVDQDYKGLIIKNGKKYFVK